MLDELGLPKPSTERVQSIISTLLTAIADVGTALNWNSSEIAEAALFIAATYMAAGTAMVSEACMQEGFHLATDMMTAYRDKVPVLFAAYREHFAERPRAMS